MQHVLTGVQLTAVAALVALSGCAMDDAESLRSFTQNSFTQNSFTQNSFTQNSFTQNSFTQNSLSDVLLLDEGLHIDTDSIDLSDPDDQQLITYLAKCALAPEDAIFATIDDQEVMFPGLLAVAPSWTTTALTDDQKEAMTACLMAHVNDFGVPVHISLRGIGQTVTPEEEAMFPWHEGTFFGNVFDQDATTYTCLGDAAPDFDTGFPHEAGDRLLRRCIDANAGEGTTTRCGFEFVGRCSEICDTFVDGNYSDCWVGDVKYSHTASTWLLSYDDPNAALTQELHDQYYGN